MRDALNNNHVQSLGASALERVIVRSHFNTQLSHYKDELLH